MITKKGLSLSITVIVSVAILLAVIAPHASAPIHDNLNINFEHIHEGVTYQEFLVTVQNLESIAKKIDLKLIIDSTSFPITDLSSVRMWVHKYIDKEIPTYEEVCLPYKYNNTLVDNCTIKQNGTTVIQALEWVDAKDQYFKRTANAYTQGMGEINIPKYSSDDGFGPGIKEFKIRINTPMINEWGSAGILRWNVSNILFYDLGNSSWWNTSWSKCKNISIDSADNNQSFEPIEINLTGLTFNHTNEIRIVSAGCSNDGDEIPRDIISNTSNSAYVVFLANRSNTSSINYSVYYDNAGVSAPSYTSSLVNTSYHSDTLHMVKWDTATGKINITVDMTDRNNTDWALETFIHNVTIDDTEITGFQIGYEETRRGILWDAVFQENISKNVTFDTCGDVRCHWNGTMDNSTGHSTEYDIYVYDRFPMFKINIGPVNSQDNGLQLGRITIHLTNNINTMAYRNSTPDNKWVTSDTGQIIPQEDEQWFLGSETDAPTGQAAFVSSNISGLFNVSVVDLCINCWTSEDALLIGNGTTGGNPPWQVNPSGGDFWIYASNLSESSGEPTVRNYWKLINDPPTVILGSEESSDSTAPDLLIITANDTHTSDTTPDISFIANDSIDTTITCTLYNDTGTAINNATPTNGTADTITFNDSQPDSRFFYYLTCQDSSSNANTTSNYSFVVDTTGPDLVITTTNDTWTADSTPDISYSVNDSLNITLSCTLYNDTGTAINNATPTNGTADTIIFNDSQGEGRFYYYLSCQDGLANANTTSNYSFRIDTIYPLIAYTSDTTSAGTQSSTTITINVSINETNINTTGWSWNSTNYTAWDGNTSEHYWVTNTSLDNGSYTFYVWVNDYMEQFNFTSSRTVNIDIDAPDINITAPENKTYSVRNVTLDFGSTEDLNWSAYLLINETGEHSYNDCENRSTYPSNTAKSGNDACTWLQGIWRIGDTRNLTHIFNMSENITVTTIVVPFNRYVEPDSSQKFSILLGQAGNFDGDNPNITSSWLVVDTIEMNTTNNDTGSDGRNVAGFANITFNLSEPYFMESGSIYAIAFNTSGDDGDSIADELNFLDIWNSDDSDCPDGNNTWMQFPPGTKPIGRCGWFQFYLYGGVSDANSTDICNGSTWNGTDCSVWTNLTHTDGYYGMILYANDSAGNNNKTSITYYTIDTTDPAIIEPAQYPDCIENGSAGGFTWVQNENMGLLYSKCNFTRPNGTSEMITNPTTANATVSCLIITYEIADNYTINITLMDYANNTDTFEIDFTVRETCGGVEETAGAQQAEPVEAPPAAVSVGGAGPGFYPDVDPYAVYTPRKLTSTLPIELDEDNIILIDDPEIAVTMIVIKPSRPYREVEINVTGHTREAVITYPPQGPTYQYFSIDTSEDLGIKNTITISFRVSNQWISATGQPAEKVSLLIWTGFGWDALPTIITNTSNTYTYFISTINHLSTFAIASVAEVPIVTFESSFLSPIIGPLGAIHIILLILATLWVVGRREKKKKLEGVDILIAIGIVVFVAVTIFGTSELSNYIFNTFNSTVENATVFFNATGG